MADPLADLIAAARQIQDAQRVLYQRHAFLPPGQMLVAAPAITGADRDVLLIPTGEQGDRILAGLRELGREPVEWTPSADSLPPLAFEPWLLTTPPADVRREPWKVVLTGA